MAKAGLSAPPRRRRLDLDIDGRGISGKSWLRGRLLSPFDHGARHAWSRQHMAAFAQLTRLIAQQRRTGRIRDHRLRPPSRPFPTVYTTADALLLAELDEAVGQLSGPATKRILWRMYHVFGDERFERLAGISNGHIYNLRSRRAYRRARTTFRASRSRGPGARTTSAGRGRGCERAPPPEVPPGPGDDPVREASGTHERLGRLHDGRWRDVVLMERRSGVVGRKGTPSREPAPEGHGA